MWVVAAPRWPLVDHPHLPGRYRVIAMATGSLPTVMALPGVPVAVLTGVTVWLLLPA